MNNALLCLEESIKLLADSFPVGVIVTQDDHIVLANQAFANIHGLGSVLDVIGQKMPFQVKNTKDWKAVHQNSMLGLNNGKLFRWACQGKQGNEYYIEGHPNRIMWYGRPAILAMTYDVTDTIVQHQELINESLALKREIRKLRTGLMQCGYVRNLVGKSKPIQEVYDLIGRASMTDLNVLIYGESGSGKEVVAKAIHEISHRKKKNFVAVNCNAVSEHLFESEFFGHKKGSFTGAVADKTGYFGAAEGGTLFLDEIGDISLNAQIKLLRVTDNGEYTPVGRSVPEKSDARLIMATNRDIIQLVRNGLMREDFFYRISIILIKVPPLRERKEDIPLLVEHFLQKSRIPQEIARIPSDVMNSFLEYNWPGNVRELQNVLLRYVATGKMEFFHKDMRQLTDPGRPAGAAESSAQQDRMQATVKNTEIKLIRDAMAESKGNKSKAAVFLGIPRRTLIRKIQAYGLE